MQVQILVVALFLFFLSFFPRHATVFFLRIKHLVVVGVLSSGDGEVAGSTMCQL
jgi:hypothetical protein